MKTDDVALRRLLPDFRRVTWEARAAGGASSWPQSLKTALSICLESRFPMILFWGPELVQFYNDAYVPILGSKHPRAYGQRAQDCWPEIWDEIAPMLHKVLQTGEATWSDDLLLRIDRSGTIEDCYFTFSYSPIRDENGIGGVFCAVTETTARVVNEREQAERARALAELDRAKTAFFENVSHEFRSPLALMLGPLESALGATSDPQTREQLETARRNALRLRKLVDNLLDLSRLEAGRFEADSEPHEIGALTANVASFFRSAVERAGLKFTIDAKPLSRTVRIDPALWERILFNLLSNALKFTFEGEITVSVREDANEAVVTVADTGIGIAAEDVPHLFERFHRIRSVRSRSIEGSGIGLAFVRELVALQGGTIDVRSAPGEGSAFSIAFPYARESVARGYAAPAAVSLGSTAYVEEAESWSQLLAVKSSGSNAVRPSVLVVDDNADFRAYLQSILASRYDVVLARSGEAALRHIADGGVDLLVTDGMMPGMDGFELVRRVRDDAERGTIPIIVLSARAAPTDTVAGLDAGADDYLPKPFVVSEFLARVETLVRTGRLRSGARRRISHLDFLSKASDVVLTSMREPREVLRAVAQTAVPDFVEWCGVYLKRGDEIDVVSVNHADRRLRELALEMHRKYPVDANGPVGRVIRSGEPLRFDDISNQLRRDVARSDEHFAYLQRIALQSLVILPLVAFGETVGVVSLATSSSGRRLNDEDVAVATVFAKRVSIAYENALLYAREHRVAEAMQSASLPKSLPSVPGIRMDAVYLPGNDEAQIGGDWYDAFRLHDGRLVISVGDVAGSGLDAAVTMSNMRQIIRGTAQVHADPVLMLNAADRALRLEDANRFVTAFVGVLDPVAWIFTYAGAGHPMPYLRHPDGRLEQLEFVDLPLGLREKSSASPMSLELPDRGLLVFYTDGVTEWAHDFERGTAALERAIADERIAASRTPANALREALLVSGTRDDVAILTVDLDRAAAAKPGSESVRRWHLDNAGSAPDSRDVLKAVGTELQRAGFSPRDATQAELVLVELLGNVVRYAPGPADVALALDRHSAVLHVLDSGPGFERAPMLPADVMSETGRGLFIVSTLTKEFNVSRRPDGGSHARAVLLRSPMRREESPAAASA